MRPKAHPAKLLWSVTVHGAETRSEIATDQDHAALRSLFELWDAKEQNAELISSDRHRLLAIRDNGLRQSPAKDGSSISPSMGQRLRPLTVVGNLAILRRSSIKESCHHCLELVLGTAASAQHHSADELRRRMIERRGVEAVIWGMPVVNQIGTTIDRVPIAKSPMARQIMACFPPYLSSSSFAIRSSPSDSRRVPVRFPSI